MEKLLILLFIVAGISLYGGNVKTVTEELSIGNNRDINISTVSTKIVVIPDSGNKVRAELVTSNKNFILEVSQDNGIEIRVRKKYLLSFFDFSSFNSVLNVYIPESYNDNLYIKSTSGRVEIENYNLNRISIKTTSGRIEGSNIISKNGDITSTSGRVVLTDSKIKNLETSTVSGRVVLDGFEGIIKGSTTSGRAELGLNTLIGDIDFTSVSGRIAVYILDKDINTFVDLKSTSGGVNIDYPISIEDSGKNRLAGTIGNGGNRINLRTVSGSINLGY